MGIRLFRLLSIGVAVVALLMAEPGNLLQRFPWPVHAATIGIGLFSGFFHLASRYGVHLPATYIVTGLIALNAAWFGNGGSYSGLPLFLFPLLCLTLVIFTGWRRIGLATLVLLNTYALLALEWRHPDWLVTFPTPHDRLIELAIGTLSCAIVTAASIGLLVYSHARERLHNTTFTRKLEASERYALALFDATSEAIVIHDEEGRLTNANRRTCELFGCQSADILRLNITDLSAGNPPYSPAEARALWQRTKQEGTQYFEWHCRRLNGDLFWAEVGLNTCEIGGRTTFIGAIRNITERHQRDHALRLMEERQRQSFEASQQGWFEIEVQTGKALVSPGYLHLLGYDPETYQPSLTSWLDGLHPDDLPAVKQIYAECVATDEPRIFEYRRRTATGEWKWIRSAARIVEHDANGRPLRMRGTHADVTELKKIEAQLHHAQRLEAIGSLTSGIAHELNNALTPLLLTSDLLKTSHAQSAEREILELWEKSVQRSARIVQQLLTFSQHTEIRRTTVATTGFLQEFAALLAKSLPPNQKLQVTLPADLWSLNADPTQLHQVLMNLCLNAQEAMPDGGTLALSAENVPALSAPSRRNPSATRGDYLRVCLSDTGRGIAPEIRDRIFDPFFTTKEIGKGMGLGLSVVHGIIESHGGFVSVESETGQGSRFCIHLPAHRSAPAVTPPPPPPVAAAAYPTLLLVDDDPAILFTSKLLLERRGYRILAAHDGPEALRLFSEHRAEIRLVITDLVMPILSGHELAARLHTIDPQLPIMAVSGNAHGDHSRDFIEVLAKPYELDRLLASIQRHLAQTSR